MNLIMPMCGYGKRFADAGYKRPKPLISVHGFPMFLSVIGNFIANGEYYKHPELNVKVVIRKDFWQEHQHELQKKTRDFLKTYEYTKQIDIEYVVLDQPTQGAADTILQSLSSIEKEDDPIFIRNCDDLCFDTNYIQSALSYFDMREADGGILVFKSDRDPKWSYVKINNDREVEKVAEKQAISDFATFGGYYFRNKVILEHAIKEMMAKNDRFNNEFYLAPVYNYLISNSQKVVPYFVNDIWGLGTPEDLEFFFKENG